MSDNTYSRELITIIIITRPYSYGNPPLNLRGITGTLEITPISFTLSLLGLPGLVYLLFVLLSHHC